MGPKPATVEPANSQAPKPPYIIAESVFAAASVMPDVNMAREEANVIADNILGALYRQGYIIVARQR